MKYTWSKTEATSKVLAVVLLSTLVYVAFGAFCGLCLPLEKGSATAVGILLGFPVWVGSMCYSVLARSGVRAWLVPLAAALVLGGSAWLTLLFG